MNTNNYKLLRTFTLLVLAFLCSQVLWAHFGSRGPFGGSVSVAISNDSTVYLGTFNGGVYESLVAWRAIPVGLRSGKITALTHNGSNLFAGTADCGVFVSTEFNCPYSNALSELPAVATGVNDLNEALNASIRIFPNPSKGQFAIELQGFKAKIEGVRIYDQQGKLLQDIVNANEFQNINTASNLPAGAYFVHVLTNEGLGVKKLLTQ